MKMNVLLFLFYESPECQKESYNIHYGGKNKMKRTVFSLCVFILAASLFLQAGASSDQKGPCTYFLLFQSTEYNSKIADAVDFFFHKVLQTGDQLAIVTPVKQYGFNQQTLQSKTKEQLATAVKTVLKRDTAVGAANYRAIVDQMKTIVLNIRSGVDRTAGAMSRGETDIKSDLVNYRQLLENLDKIRMVKESLLLKLAQIANQQKGQKQLFVFYDKEIIPIPTRETMDNLRQSRTLGFDATEVFEADEAEEPIVTEKVGQAFATASVIFNLVYINKQIPRDRRFQMKDHSQDMYSCLSKLAELTGGMVETTAKPEIAFKNLNR
jgi:hypothetical protein